MKKRDEGTGVYSSSSSSVCYKNNTIHWITKCKGKKNNILRYYIIAGEASGDMHAARLVKALRDKQPKAIFRGWGGDLMEEAGVEVRMHYRELAFMGFWEVVKNLPTILRNFRICKADVQSWNPDVLILVDYPGFNLRMAAWAHRLGFKVVYYISPQVWAWKSSRVKKIQRYVDLMLVILPFEPEFYQERDVEVTFVGHPLLDALKDFPSDPQFREVEQLDNRPIIALLPGSRKQEIERMLEVMLAVVPQFPSYQWVVAGAPAQNPEYYDQLLQRLGSPGAAVKVVHGKTYALLSHAKAALVTSGTATLETALLNVPQVVLYRGSALSYWLAKRLVKIDYISLVNLIAKRPVVEELIQQDCHPEKITRALKQVLDDTHAHLMQTDYALLREKLGGEGASERAARAIVEYVDSFSQDALV